MSGALDGRVCAITGAGRGIGREHALLFAASGAHVVVNDLGGAGDGTGSDASAAQAVADEIAAAGGEAVVGLTVSVGDGCGWLNGFPIGNALPFWPGCVPVRLTGDIVRRRNISP